MRLRQAVATFYGQDPMAISPTNFMKSSAGASFIQGSDLERAGSQGSTYPGVSTKDGAIVQLAVNSAPLPNGGQVLIC